MPSSGEYQRDDVIGDRYRVLSTVGRGGMGLVYQVEQVFIKKIFALKTIDKHLLSETVVRRFQQEAKATFALQHPNIVSVYDFGVLADQTPFLAMEFVDGETVADWIKSHGAMFVDTALPMFIQICFGLAYAHELGIVHRDIKPSNIMLVKGVPWGTDGSIKILDFGLAKFTLHEEGEVQALTRTGEIFGSPVYMSPEQCSGFKTDQRTDIYSLGCVFFEALTGSPPFVGETALSTMLQHQNENPPTLKEASLGAKFPQALEDIVACMLSKSPDKRYSGLGELVHDLAAVKSGGDLRSGTGKTARVEALAKTNTISMRRFTLFLLVATVAVTAFSLGSFGTYFCMLPQIRSAQVQPAEQKPFPDADAGIRPSAVPTPENPSDDETSTFLLSDKELQTQLTAPNSIHRLSIQSPVPNALTISGKQFKQIAATPWITNLHLTGVKFEDQDLKNITSMPLLELTLEKMTLDKQCAVYISKLRQIKRLNVRETTIDDDGAILLARMPRLEAVDMSRTSVGDRTLAVLAKNDRLGELKLNDCKQITLEGIKLLKGKSLFLLDLAGTCADDDSLTDIITTLPYLKKLGISNTSVSTKALAAMVRAMPGLREVQIQDCRNADFRDLDRQFKKHIFREYNH
jgi:serine/threonine protein kinase